MKSIEKTNISVPERRRMTLRDYYRQLPDANTVAPRKELVQRVARRCNVPTSTARAWLRYGNQPRREVRDLVVKVLQEETGIAPEDMWED